LYFLTILILNIFLSRYFEAGNAGWIFYLSNNFSFILIIVGLTMENSVNYYASTTEIGLNRLIWFSLAWSTLAAVVVFTGILIFSGFFKNNVAISNRQYLYYAVCYIGGIQLTNFFTVLFYSTRNFFLPNFLMVLLNAAFIALIPKQVGSGHTDALFITELYFAFFVITGLTLAAAFIIKQKGWQQPITLPSGRQLSLLVKYAFLALAANVIFFLVYRIDYWFVKKFCTLPELGNYIQVSKLGQMLLIVPSIISSVVFPHTAGGMPREEMKDKILRIGRIISVLYIILFAFILLAGKWMFPFIFGYTYRLMYYPFLLLLPGIWALSNLFVLSAYFGGVNKVKVNVMGAAIALLVIVAGDVIFIPAYGIKGAAAVSSAGYFVNFFYSFFHMKKEHPVSIKQYLPLNKVDIQWLRSIIRL
jgi:O-antigen/teichoic acid export membrane protein